jgi:hypothetical protein
MTNLEVTSQDEVSFSYTTMFTEIRMGVYHETCIMVIGLGNRTLHAIERPRGNQVQVMDMETAEFFNLIFVEENPNANYD